MSQDHPAEFLPCMPICGKGTGSMWKRIKALIIKETLAVLRDPRNHAALIAPPLLQHFLFSFTGTQHVKNIRLAMLNQNSGEPSSELVQRLSASSNFTDVYFLQSRERKYQKRFFG